MKIILKLVFQKCEPNGSKVKKNFFEDETKNNIRNTIENSFTDSITDRI